MTEVLVAAFVICALATPIIAYAAKRCGWTDKPGGLKNHPAPVPYGGGIAIAVATFLSVQIFGRGEIPVFSALFLPSALVLLGGIWDDVTPLSVAPKFLIQFTAAILVVGAGVHLEIRALPVSLNIALTLFWIVGMTNAVNIIDIMDGLAGGVCGIAALTFGLIGILTGDFMPAVLGLALCGALSGFLVFNFHPARIFMGDAGSQLAGFLLAVTAILDAYTANNDIALIAPALILGIPIYDTLAVSYFRLRKGSSPFHGSPDHVALKLNRKGLSIQATVRFLLFVSLLLSGAATVATLVPAAIAAAMYSLVSLLAVWFTVYLYRFEASVTRSVHDADHQ